jgi:ATP-binding cassette subfamily B protein
MVLQDPWVFDGTLLENLTFGTKDAPMEKVERAITAVGLDYYINTLPEKLNTMLGDKMQLSQGQKQQISIARAMIADKPMVILDEATSSIDTRTEKKIQEAMNKLMEGRTSFVIAHRLSTIRNADVILVLKDGDVVEQGSHDALIAKGGFYYELYNSQFDPATRSLEKSGSKSGSKSKSGS